MATSHLTVSVRPRQGIAILDLGGDIDGFAEAALAAGYAEAAQGEPRAIVLNFGAVHYLNSTGIGLVADLVANARSSGRRLLAHGLSDHFVETFTITRLADFVGLHDTEAAIAEAERPNVRQRTGAYSSLQNSCPAAGADRAQSWKDFVGLSAEFIPARRDRHVTMCQLV